MSVNAMYRLCETILYLILGRFDVFISILGFVALGLESTLPIPQLIRLIFMGFRLHVLPP